MRETTDVRVKALEWNENGFAHTDAGIVFRVMREPGFWKLEKCQNSSYMNSAHANEEAAKAAAQADFERRIRAALEPAPKPAGEDLRAVAVDNNKVHPTHRTRISMDASTYDEICDACGATDHVPGGLGRLIYSCPNYEAPKPAGGEWVTLPVLATEEMIEAGLAAYKRSTTDG